MRAAMFYGGTDIRVQDVDPPHVGPGDALVRIAAAGICGSDLLAYQGRGPWQYDPQHPELSGHELAGEVVSVGSDVRGVEVGAHVAVEPTHLLSCGACELCRAGTTQLCQQRGHHPGLRTHSSGFAEFDSMPAGRLHPLPERISLDEAALIDCYACAVHALHLAQAAPGAERDHPMVILGAGTIGLTFGQVARAHGHRVVLTGTRDPALQLARSAGAADAVINVRTEDLAKAVAAHTAGRGPAVVIDAVGDPDVTLAQAIDVVRPGGAIIVMGVYTRSPDFDPSRAFSKEVGIRWSNSYGRCLGESEFSIATRLMTGGRVDAAPLITHRFGLEQISDAFATALDRRRTSAMKVLVVPDPESQRRHVSAEGP